MPLQSTLFPFDAVQATTARSLKLLLDLSQQINDRQSDAAMSLLQGALGSFSPEMVSATRELLDVQADLAIGLGTQWKNTLDHCAQRSSACLADLRRAGDHTEVVGTLVVLATDLGQQLRSDSERVGQLVGSAGEAGKVLFVRALDGVASAAATEGEPERN